jgi:hypothetical protein
MILFSNVLSYFFNGKKKFSLGILWSKSYFKHFI